MLNPDICDSPSLRIHYKEYADIPVVFPMQEKVLMVASVEMNSVRLLTLRMYMAFLTISEMIETFII